MWLRVVLCCFVRDGIYGDMPGADPLRLVALILVLILFLGALVLHVMVSFSVGATAGRELGNTVPWTLGFLLVPIVSHGFYLTLLYWRKKKRKELSVLKRIEIPPQRIVPLEPAGDDKHAVSVTPFCHESGRGVRDTGPHSILDDFRDRKIDELMEWDQWGKAYELAEQKLACAESIGDGKSAEVYRAYLMIIGPKTGKKLLS